jgi:hypothetical protein
MTDMTAKGRSKGKKNGPKNPPRGERNHLHKMTEAQIVEIRLKYATGNYQQRPLAKEYGLSQATLGAIVRCETWKHVGKSIS